MQRYYFDSSALAKLYHTEPGSEVVEHLFRQPAKQFLISRLTVLEITSVLGIKVRMGSLRVTAADALRDRFEAHCISGDIRIFAVMERDWRRAETLMFQYSYRYRLRSLDALQLAVGLHLRERAMVDEMIASDLALCEIAALEGLLVRNPERS